MFLHPLIKQDLRYRGDELNKFFIKQLVFRKYVL